jgi:DNA modification methylase
VTLRAEIIHGDCLAVMRTLAPGSVDAIVTDPDYATTGDAAIASSRTTRVPPETQFYAAWLRDMVTEWVRVLRPTGAVWLTLDWRGCMVLDAVAARCGIRRAPKVGVWDKENIGMGGVLRCSYETFAVLMMDDFELTGRSERDVWRLQWGGGQKIEHPAEKPVELMRRALRLLAPAGALILDPFCGSGTTGVACVRDGYAFLGIEREAEYVAIARRRIAEAQAQTTLFGDVA